MVTATAEDGRPQEMDFHHPYQPYQIQTDLMTAIYDCIEQGKVGIFESPTGTGKSLSLLCASLTWLRNHKRGQFEHDAEPAELGDEPDWMREHTRRTRHQELLQRRADLEVQLEQARIKERGIRNADSDSTLPRKRIRGNPTNAPDSSDSAFVLDEYNSDDDSGKSHGKAAREDDFSDQTKQLLKAIGLGPRDEADNGVEDEDELKIFICSRTHSQLSQLVGELKRIQLPSSYPSSSGDEREEFPIEGIKQLTLGSRRNLCINDEVRNLPSTSQINERCLELQEAKTARSARCKYLPSADDQAVMLDFKHHVLSKARDIEDLFKLGKKIGICPYYAARPVMRSAELVTLPYPLLLDRTARAALDISVKDHVVIIDEAHNLIDAILGIHTTEVTLSQLTLAREQLLVYLQKFRNRLAGKNRVYVTQMLRLLGSLKAFLEAKQGNKSDGGILSSNDLLAGQGVDQINLYKLGSYLRTSKLARKVQGYVAETTKGEKQQTPGAIPRVRASPVLDRVQNFIMALMNPAKEGRFFWNSDGTANGTSVKYLLLDPSEHFKEVVADARSVIMLGGTMSPMDDYKTQLLPFLPADKLSTVSCGHVIPRTNLYIRPLSTGVGGQKLDFTFASRNSPVMLRDVGRSIVQMVEMVPDGVVIFFPSYSYLAQVMKVWEQPASGDNESIVSSLERSKKIFIDQQGANAEHLLEQYSAAILKEETSLGAVLLSVIGGKLSEGINFSDRLGRCVMVVGLPYPNPNSQEWKAKMEFIEAKARTKQAYTQGAASREFADNVCMRAVNQAIGRAVRHKDDWAAIVLLDQRFCSKRIQDRLPKWMLDSDGGSKDSQRGGFAEVERGLHSFYGRMVRQD